MSNKIALNKAYKTFLMIDFDIVDILLRKIQYSFFSIYLFLNKALICS